MTSLSLAVRTVDLVDSIVDASLSAIAAYDHDIVPFAMGAPGHDLVPAAIFDELYAVPKVGKYGYGTNDGEPELIEQIIALSAAEGVTTSADRIVVTSGAIQGIDLAFKLFVNPGDLVVIEGPTYTNSINMILAYGAECLEVPVDEHGMVVEMLPELVAQAGRTPKVIYTVPTFQNPSGVVLSHSRRELLIELAERWNAVIVDDDPYGMLRFEGERVPSFSELAPRHPLVFAARTFSKILAPGMRVGWIDADPSVRQLLMNAKQVIDTCASVPAQLMIANFLAGGHLDAHLSSVKGLYRERKEAMASSLRRHFGDQASSTDPHGGFFLWMTLQERYSNIDTRDLFDPALQQGVAFIPGPSFSTREAFHSSLRLCFATSTPERIEEGIARLKTAADAMLTMPAPA